MLKEEDGNRNPQKDVLVTRPFPGELLLNAVLMFAALSSIFPLISGHSNLSLAHIFSRSDKVNKILIFIALKSDSVEAEAKPAPPKPVIIDRRF